MRRRKQPGNDPPRRGRQASRAARRPPLSRPARRWSIELLTRRRLIAAGAVALAALALVLAAISAHQATTAAPRSKAEAETSHSYLPPTRLTSIDGKPISLPAGRPGMVMLSSSLCTTCFLTVRYMGKLKSQMGPRIDAAFISVDPGDSTATLADRRDSVGDPPIPFAIDASGTLAAAYHMTTLGTVVIYDAAGKIAQRSIEPTLSDLQAAFRRVSM